MADRNLHHESLTRFGGAPLGLRADWAVADDSAAGAAATATKAAEAGRRHVVCHISASWDTNPTTGTLVQVKTGSTVLWSVFLKDKHDEDFSMAPLSGDVGASIVITATAATGSKAAVSVAGRTI